VREHHGLLGSPVVPEVNTMVAISSSRMSAPRPETTPTGTNGEACDYSLELYYSTVQPCDIVLSFLYRSPERDGPLYLRCCMHDSPTGALPFCACRLPRPEDTTSSNPSTGTPGTHGAPQGRHLARPPHPATAPPRTSPAPLPGPPAGAAPSAGSPHFPRLPPCCSHATPMHRHKASGTMKTRGATPRHQQE